jgi:hypothetical protein
MKNQKWTKINVHFQKSQNTFEKTLHHSLIRHPPGRSLSIFGEYYIFVRGLKSRGEVAGRARASAYEK